MFNLKTYLYERAEDRFLKNLRPLSSYSRVVDIPDMGRGVVILEGISAGALLGVYPGERRAKADFLEKEDFVKRSVRSAYLHTDGMIIDPTDVFGYLPDVPQLRIAFINEPSQGVDVNVRAISTKKYVWYIATKDILPGQQLFTHYGTQYQRSYLTDLASQAKVDLGDLEADCLRQVGESYPWIKEGVFELLSACSN